MMSRHYWFYPIKISSNPHLPCNALYPGHQRSMKAAQISPDSYRDQSNQCTIYPKKPPNNNETLCLSHRKDHDYEATHSQPAFQVT